MAASDNEFMAMLEKDFPNENWDNVPDPETLPDIYIIQGKQRGSGNWPIHFEVHQEYTTMEAAQIQVEHCKQWTDVIADTIEIIPKKSANAVWKWMYKEWKERIEKGDSVFPMNLP